jgi:glutaconate CoA-transferase subunit A
VAADVIATAPERTILPAHRVAAVSLAAAGAHPSYVQDCYGRDDAHYSEYDKISRQADALAASPT